MPPPASSTTAASTGSGLGSGSGATGLAAAAFEMPFGDHLEELRRRIIYILLGLLPILVLGLASGRQGIALLIRPAQSALRSRGLPDSLIATGVLETFLAYFGVAATAAVLIGSPWALYQAWRFVAPGLYSSEKRFVYVLLPLSSVLTVASSLFLYFVMVPVVLAFFVGFGSTIGAADPDPAPPPAGVIFGQPLPVLDRDPIDPAVGQYWINRDLRQLRICLDRPAGGEPVILGSPLTRHTAIRQDYKVSTYLRLVLTLAIGLAIAFQTPVVVLLLGWAGLVERAVLTRYRKHIAFGCAIVSAVLTPADPLSMLVLAVPLYILFELGSLLLVVLPASRIAGPPLDETDAGPGA